MFRKRTVALVESGVDQAVAAYGSASRIPLRTSQHHETPTLEEDLTVKPIPDGYYSVTPYLIVEGAADAIEFYKKGLQCQ